MRILPTKIQLSPSGERFLSQSRRTAPEYDLNERD